MKEPKANLSYATDLLSLQLLYKEIFDTLDAMAGGFVYVEDDHLNYWYTNLLVKIEIILDKDGFSDLKADMPKNYESLLGLGQEIDMSWEFQRSNMLQFRAKLDKKIIIEISNEVSFEVTIPKEVFSLLGQTEKAIKTHRILRKKAHDVFEKQAVRTQVDTVSKKKTATLSFVNISRPQIVVGENIYKLNAMRSFGNAFKMIEYCLKHHDQEFSLDDLRVELKLSGVNNIKVALQHSYFDAKYGLLRPFIAISNNVLLAKDSALLDDTQIAKIKLADVKPE